MKKSLARIKQLHDQGKISSEEYQNLIKSVTPSPIFRALSIKMLFNPFHYAKGGSAFIAGILLIALFSFLASNSFIHFPGTLDLRIIDSKITNISFWYIFFQNLAIVFSLAIFFLLASISAKNAGIRLFNLIGNLLLARIPFFIATLLLILASKFVPQIIFLEQTLSKQMALSQELIVAMAILIPCLVWQCLHYFLALKNSCELKNKWLWIVFIVGVLASEATMLKANQHLFTPKLQRSQIDQDPKTQDAVEVAHQWLELVAQKKYSTSWDNMATSFQAAFSKSKWIDLIKPTESYGKVIDRKLISTTNSSTPTEGSSIKLIFETQFDRIGTVKEHLSLVFENKKWLLSGYFVM